MRSLPSVTTGAFLFITSLLAAQSTPLTIKECYDLARQNYPLIVQKELVKKSKEYSVANVRSGFLPQFSLAAQATYQSEVTRLPGPATFVEPLSKDQYRIYSEVIQTVYDGGTIRKQMSITETNNRTEDQKIEVELFRVRERINQVFFGILMQDELLGQVELFKKDIQSGLDKMRVAIQQGTALKIQEDILQAELLKAEQRKIEIRGGRQAYLEMMSLLINKPLDEQVQMEMPQVPEQQEPADIARPELFLYQFQADLAGAQFQLSQAKARPRVGLFLQGGYGRPGLNMLENEFDTYYQGGVRISWNLTGLYNSNRDREILKIQTQSALNLKDVFLFNTHLLLRQQSAEISKLEEMISVDKQIIELRVKIKNTAKLQLENGVITANDFVRELNAEDQAVQNKLLHEVQLLMAQYALQNTVGK